VQGSIPIGVAGFESGWMLVWTAAAAIPIVMHLLNRRRQQTIAWAAMQLLQRVIEKQSKRIRIEQLILLLIRTAVLIVLGIAVARPYWTLPNQATTSVGRASKLWILVLDTSYSMGYRESNGTRFTTAQQKATEIIRQSESGDAFAVVALAEPSTSIVRRPTFDSDSVIAAIQKAKLQDGGADLGSAIAQVNEVVKLASENADIPKNIAVVFLSDFGKDTWQAALPGAELSKNLLQLAKSTTLLYESVGDGSSENVAITELRSSKSRGLKNHSLEVEVTIANAGENPVTQLPIQLDANSQTVESKFVDLPAGVTRSVRMEYKPDTNGPLVLTARIPDDRLAVDNRRDSLVQIQDDYRILCVENPHTDARILKTAINPGGTPRQGLLVTSVDQLEFTTRELNEFDAIILNDVTAMNAIQFQRISDFVRSGKALIGMFGSYTDASQWNELLANKQNLLGLRFSSPSETADWRIDPGDYQNEIVAPFADYPDAGLLTTPIFRFWKIEKMQGQTDRPPSTVEVMLQDGHPLVVRHQWGSGWVTSLLSSPQAGNLVNGSEPWNAMAAWPSFVPLIQQIVNSTLNRNTANLNRSVGEVLSGTQALSGTSSQIVITRPSGDEVVTQSGETDQVGRSLWTFGQTYEHGIYRVRQSDGRTVAFAVNIDARQSDLQPVANEALPKSTLRPNEEIELSGTTDFSKQANDLSKYLLVCLAILLVTESSVAWLFGRRLG
jgi:Aerotolerance regulator N-terminal/von Willebrand factor type A domain